MAEETKNIRFPFHPHPAGVPVRGPVLEKWESPGIKELTGYPVAPESAFKNGCRLQRFQKGYIAYGPGTGAHPVTGRFRFFWADSLGVFGPLGLPAEDASDEDGVPVQRFAGGTLRGSDPCIAGGIDLRGEFARRGIALRDQGPRGTCSVQVMVCLQEYLYAGLLGREFAHLSVEYANHAANAASGDRDDGHCFVTIAQGYEAYGIVPESLWPYEKSRVYDFDEAQSAFTPDMTAEGRRLLAKGLRLRGRFIKGLDGRPGLSEEQFASLLAVLGSGLPAGVGRDHSLTAVGYKLDKTQPGGGFMLFRNSWGTGPDYTGYQTETFENVRNTVNDVYVYECGGPDDE